jgi:hypothetical protein
MGTFDSLMSRNTEYHLVGHGVLQESCRTVDKCLFNSYVIYLGKSQDFYDNKLHLTV